jgi:hypothetical protein
VGICTQKKWEMALRKNEKKYDFFEYIQKLNALRKIESSEKVEIL